MRNVTRNVRTYDHFCLVARALERVGDRWSMLVIRDLLTGAKRFTDLMDRLSGITPKTLSQRLRELEDTAIVTADREPGRREVWYRLTPAGADLAPVIDGLSWWGLQHAWRWPQAGEPLHAEHLLRSAIQAIDLATDDHRPVCWHFRLDGTDYLAQSDGHSPRERRPHQPTSRSPRPPKPLPPSSSPGQSPASTSPANQQQSDDSANSSAQWQPSYNPSEPEPQQVRGGPVIASRLA
jgi:DNA-binding HxlR family transcriptional regulator